MQGTGFISLWHGSGLVSHSRDASAAGGLSKICQAPSMALRSHEEIETLFDGGDFKTARYRLNLTISGETSKENRKLSVQQVKKNGNFNGFRKGTIPPFVMKQVEEFVLRDCIESEIRDACEELGMKFLEGEGSEPDFDFKELKSRFVVSKDFDFSCDVALQTDYKKAADAEDAADVVETSDDVPAKTAKV